MEVVSRNGKLLSINEIGINKKWVILNKDSN